jgi:L-threonylcarbamoyladenylate synthase
MITKFVKIDRKRPDERKIRLAARIIRRGGIVIFPTETVYGIGADAFNKRATAKIYKLKGRPSDNPLMIHVSDMRMASRIGVIPKRYYKAVEKAWPGPIAFVVDAKKTMPGRTELAMRMPSHRVALELIKASRTPIAAPSANISKKPSATNARHVLRHFDGKVDMIIDSGPSDKGIESTIIDLRTFKLLRPGAFPVERIERIFGRKPIVTDQARGIREAKKAISPGMKYRHYSPSTPLFMYTGRIKSLSTIAHDYKKRIVFIGSREACNMMTSKGIRVIDIGKRSDIDEIARNLFDALIKLDEMGADFAIIESFNEKGIGLGVMNRIRKASNNKKFSSKKQLHGFISDR